MTLHLDLDQLRWLYRHLKHDERAIAQRIRDLVGFEIARWEQLEEIRCEQAGLPVHIARSWE